ncbi:plasmid stabilization protein [Streptomyces sp. alain-838]|nr:plasmid stabilization protein [Streptomyces sp. alain-838]PAK23648.1 plasmid stabilization protein [Streptomyces sp. alain-838]
MPAGSSSKRERQYEHIKDSAEDRGASKGRAKEIAARTVNKERAQSGEAKSASRSSTKGKSPSRRGGEKSGSSRGGSGGGPTREQLYQEAKKKGIEGRSTMNKDQLAKALDRN